MDDEFRQNQNENFNPDPDINKPYKCKEPGCKKAYMSQSNLNKHTNDYHRCIKTCCKCSTVIQTPPFVSTFFDITGTVIYKKETFNCTNCHLYFGSFKLFWQPPNTKYVFYHCDECRGRFLSIRDLNRHYRGHIKYQCLKGCVDVALSRIELKKHYGLDHEHKGPHLTCDNCGKCFRNKALLRDHAQIHMPRIVREQFSCSYKNCSRKYFHKRNLLQHVMRAHTKTSYTCEYCGRHLSSQQKLKQHVTALHHLKRSPQGASEKRIIITRPSAVHSLLGIREFKVTGGDASMDKPTTVKVNAKKNAASKKVKKKVTQDTTSFDNLVGTSTTQQGIGSLSRETSQCMNIAHTPIEGQPHTEVDKGTNRESKVKVEDTSTVKKRSKSMPSQFISIVYK